MVGTPTTSDTDSTFTYKITGQRRSSTTALRLRGGYNRATRAPNLGELFLNAAGDLHHRRRNFGDPCGLRSNAPFGAGGVAAGIRSDPADSG